MLTDARSLPDGHDLEADVCIIGAGPAGITLATELVGTGLRVCLLDAGGRTVTKADRHRLRGESVGSPYFPLERARASTFGGTNATWPRESGWRARRLDPIDFESRGGVPDSGWPFAYQHLEPFYRRAENLSKLGSYDVSEWEDANSPRLPLDPSRVGTVIYQFSRTFFPDLYHDLAREPDITVVLHASVVNLESGPEPQRIDRVVGRHLDGRTFGVRARAVVIAAGAIENARLLLVSRSRHTSGLGNRHDLVGRFFMERFNAHAGFVTTAAARHASLYEPREVGGRLGQATLRLTDDTIRREQLLNCSFFVLPREQAYATEGARSAAVLVKELNRRPRPKHLPGHVRNVVADGEHLVRLGLRRALRRQGDPTALIVRTSGEQSPNPESRVTLGGDKDALGVPRARLDWRPTDFDRKMHRRGEEILAAEFARAGVGRVERLLGEEYPPSLIEGAHHHMGTTRMHADPKRGVVDPDARVHGLENLYVAGSSVFPTTGCSNPTLTILALALRLADHLRATLNSGGG